MAADGTSGRSLDASALTTLVPRLSYRMVDRLGDGILYEEVEGSLLSADISGFTRLTEQLADRGRHGAEIITEAINSCFGGLIAVGEHYGGDALKFGGDAVLMLFTGPDHRNRSATAAQQMQFALRNNSHARRHDLAMTVGVADGNFHAMVIGSQRRDLLLCGRATSHALTLEGGAEIGEAVVSTGIADAITQRTRAGGVVLVEDYPSEPLSWPELDDDAITAFVPPELAAYWSDYAELGAEHRQAAIGFVSVGGVDDHIDDAGGRATAQALSAFWDEACSIAAAADTAILHSDMAVGGIKLLIGAGVPRSTDHPADALLMASLRIASIQTPFVVRQGLNIGTVFAGFVGAPHRRAFTVMSDPVNTAARMVGPAGPGEVVAVETLAQRARGHVEGDLLDPLTVKGKVNTILARRVTGLGRSQREGATDVDFVGRDDEVDALSTALERSDGVVIVGSVGAGKTRLTNEVVSDTDVVETSGSPYLTATPYAAFWNGMRALFGIAPQAGPEDAGEALGDWLSARHPDLTPWLALLALLVGGEADESPEVASLEAEFRRDTLNDLVVQLLDRHEPPISAVIIEDTQWLDDASRELARHLQSAAATSPWMVVQSARPADDGVDDADTAGLRIELGPLSAEAVAAIITKSCERQLLHHELDRLVERANGNPLFALELARAVGQPGQEVPGSIEEVILARIDRLPRRARNAVRLASLLGPKFTTEDYRSLAAVAGLDVEPDLSAVTDIVQVDGASVRFQQLLYRDVAYDTLPFASRKRLHKVFAQHLESEVDDPDPIATELSHHYRAAGDRRKCWDYSLIAAARAVRQYSPVDAITLFRRALDFAPRGIDHEARSAAHAGLGRALVAAGNLEEAHEAFGKARRLTDDPVSKLRWLCDQADCRNRQGRFSDALRAYSRVLAAGDVSSSVRAVATHGRGAVLYRIDRNREAHQLGYQALELARAADLPEVEAQAWNLIASTGERLGTEDRSDATQRALEIFREIGALSQEAEVLNNIGVTAQLEGDLDAAADAYRESLALKQRVGDASGAAMVQMNLAEVDLDNGRSEGVEDLLTSCLRTFSRTGFTVGQAYTQGLLGRASMMTGKLDQARSMLESASNVFLDLGAEGHSADMDLLLVEVLIQIGATAEARRMLSLNRLRLDRDVFDNPAMARARIEDLEQRALA